MKITNKIITYIRKVSSHTTTPKQLIKLEPPRDTFIKSARPFEVSPENILTVKKNVFGEYVFMDGKKEVGFASIKIHEWTYGDTKKFPEDWFEKDATTNLYGKRIMKPYMYVSEFSMNDRINKKSLVKRDKKYGTMAMQHLLALAREKGCDYRIALYAGQLGRTKFMPGRFYHKMGFSLPYDKSHALEMMEFKYNKELKKLIKEGISQEEAERTLEQMNIYLPEKQDGRYISEYGEMFLSNPECVINYPLK